MRLSMCAQTMHVEKLQAKNKKDIVLCIINYSLVQRFSVLCLLLELLYLRGQQSKPGPCVCAHRKPAQKTHQPMNKFSVLRFYIFSELEPSFSMTLFAFLFFANKIKIAFVALSDVFCSEFTPIFVHFRLFFIF